MTIENVQSIDFQELAEATNLIIADNNCTVFDIENIIGHCSTRLNYLTIQSSKIKQLPNNLNRLINLTDLHLDLKKLSNLPTHCLPDGITSLHIKCPNLEELSSESLNNLIDLSYLTIEAPLSKMIDLSVFKWLNTFQLSQSDVESIGENKEIHNRLFSIYLTKNKRLKTLNLSPFPALERLYVNGNVHEVETLGTNNCPKLVNIDLNKVNTLSNAIQNCTSLRSLHIINGSMTELPDWIMELIELKSLSITSTSLKKIPKNWESLKNLENLNLDHNAIEDFSFAYALPALKRLGISGNPIKDPLFMLDGIKKLPVNSTNDLFQFSALAHKELLSFMSALGRSGLNRADKEWFFNQFRLQKLFIVPDNWELYRYMQALNIPFPFIVDKSTRVLQNLEINKEAIINFKSGANVCLMGTFSQDKNDIKKQLNWLNINTVSTFDNTVTHLIIGSKPKGIADLYTVENPPFLLEHQLYAALQEVGKEDKFLVQEAAVGESQMTEGVKQLLQSNEAISVSLGLEMLKTGGVPADILDDLIVLNKTFNDAKIRTECKKILELNCTAEWVNVIKDKQIFVDIANTKNKDIRDKLEKMAKSVDKKHVHLLAMLFFNYFEKGINFSLANFGLHATERVAALNALTTGDFFDFFKGVGYHNWKDKKPEEIILSVVNTGIAFPTDHPNPLAIKKIKMHNCKLDTLGKDMDVFQNLEELDVSVNNLKSLPMSFGKLKKLKRLDLSCNRLTAFPKALLDLHALEVVDLRFNDSHAFKTNTKTAIDIPVQFMERLPNCTVLL